MFLLRDPEFWVLIAFVIAFGFFAWKASPLMLGALDQRAVRIKAELDEVRRLRTDAERALTEYRQKQSDALKEAADIIAHARTEAERAAAAGERELEAALERRRRLASRRSPWKKPRRSPQCASKRSKSPSPRCAARSPPISMPAAAPAFSTRPSPPCRRPCIRNLDRA